eukprot:5003681-Prymnesium_polylepis.2
MQKVQTTSAEGVFKGSHYCSRQALPYGALREVRAVHRHQACGGDHQCIRERNNSDPIHTGCRSRKG